jgi:hypothetical protein
MDYAQLAADLHRIILANGEQVSWSQATAAQDGDKPWNNDSEGVTGLLANAIFVQQGSGILSALVHAMNKTDVPAQTIRAIVLPRALLTIGSLLVVLTPTLGDLVTRRFGQASFTDATGTNHTVAGELNKTPMSVASISLLGTPINIIGWLVGFNQG